MLFLSICGCNRTTLMAVCIVSLLVTVLVLRGSVQDVLTRRPRGINGSGSGSSSSSVEQTGGGGWGFFAATERQLFGIDEEEDYEAPDPLPLVDPALEKDMKARWGRFDAAFSVAESTNAPQELYPIPVLNNLQMIRGGVAPGVLPLPENLSAALLNYLRATEPALWFQKRSESLTPIPGVNLGVFGRTLLIDTLQCWTEGEWVRNPQQFKPMYPFINNAGNVLTGKVQMKGGKMRAMRNDIEISELEQRSMWQWVSPPTCAIPFRADLSSAELCSILNGRGILIVGDSMNEQFFRSILSVLMAGSIAANTLKDFTPQQRKELLDADGRGMEICNDWSPELNMPRYPSANLKFRYNSKLSYPGGSSNTTLTQKDGTTHFNHNQAWSSSARKHEIVILAPKSYPHISAAQFQMQMLHTLSKIREENIEIFPNQMLLYRSTTRAHFNCSGHKRPTSMFDEEDFANWNKVSEGPDSSSNDKQWDIIFHQDELVKPILNDKIVRALYMDVRRMTALRPDGHDDDCVRYQEGVGSPIDSWTLHLFNMLRIIPILAKWEREMMLEYGLSKRIPALSVSPPFVTESYLDEFGIIPKRFLDNKVIRS